MTEAITAFYDEAYERTNSKLKAIALTIISLPLLSLLQKNARKRERKKRRIKQEERMRMEARKEIEQERYE